MTHFSITSFRYRSGVWAVTSLVIITSLLGLKSEEELYDPVAFFLTWQQDPTSTMTIDWHTIPEDGDRESSILYKEAGDNQWHEAEGASHEFPHSDRMIHRVEITGLEPGTSYRFRFGEDSKVYSFKTLPADISDPIRFAVGGDTGIGEDFIKMNQVVMEYDPDFIVWGGDLAYADADPAHIERWYAWFSDINESLVYDDGRIVPIVVAIGDHEVFGVRRLSRETHPTGGLNEQEIIDYMEKYGLEEDKPTFFFELFAFPGPQSYNILDFGDYLSLIALDSDIYSDIEGDQTAWLEDVLSTRQDRPHVFPVYHEPAYPSHSSFTANTSVLIRENWVPLFEQYGVRVAFEHDNHTYKRTWPIRNNEIAEDGIIYIGDGAWVVNTRDGNRKDEWYIKEFASINHGIIVTLHEEIQSYLMVSREGDVIDSFSTADPLELPPPPPPSDRVVMIHPQQIPRVDLQPKFSWEPVSDATAYQLQIAVGNYGPGLLLDTTVQHTEITYPGMLEADSEYRWQVRALNDSGHGPWPESDIRFRTVVQEVTSSDEDPMIPNVFSLDNNYPNPFNPATTIRYGLPVTAHVEIQVYDIIGRKIATLINQEQAAGYHTAVFNAESLNSGLYIYRLTAIPVLGSDRESFNQTGNMTLIK